MAVPCDDPPSLYIETAVPAALAAFTDILFWDPKEGYHKLRGNSLYHDGKGAVEDMEKIPPAEESRATRFFFNTSKLLDIELWYVFLGDVLSEGILNWMSQLYRVSDCKFRGDPRQGHGQFFFGALPDDGNFNTLSFSFRDDCIFAPASPSALVVQPGQSWIMTGSASFKSFDGTPVPCQASIINRTTGAVYDHDDADQKSDTDFRKTHVFAKGRNNSATPHTIWMAWQYTGSIPLPEREAFPEPADCYIYMGIFGGPHLDQPTYIFDNPPT